MDSNDGISSMSLQWLIIASLHRQRRIKRNFLVPDLESVKQPPDFSRSQVRNQIMCERPLIHITQGKLMDVPTDFAKLLPDK